MTQQSKVLERFCKILNELRKIWNEIPDQSSDDYINSPGDNLLCIRSFIAGYLTRVYLTNKNYREATDFVMKFFLEIGDYIIKDYYENISKEEWTAEAALAKHLETLNHRELADLDIGPVLEES